MCSGVASQFTPNALRISPGRQLLFGQNYRPLTQNPFIYITSIYELRQPFLDELIFLRLYSCAIKVIASLAVLMSLIQALK